MSGQVGYGGGGWGSEWTTCTGGGREGSLRPVPVLLLDTLRVTDPHQACWAEGRAVRTLAMLSFWGERGGHFVYEAGP